MEPREGTSAAVRGVKGFDLMGRVLREALVRSDSTVIGLLTAGREKENKMNIAVHSWHRIVHSVRLYSNM